ncbi:MAG TPA: response regulator [Methylomirabilota bacterium]|nr:response regulator [Methylomirabilota bacterium]
MTTAPALRVLIVEDEPELGAVFRDYIAGRGHQVAVVGAAEAALERLGAGWPHAIVLDVKLPGMSGVDFMRLAPVREAGVPVIVVSGHATERQARECLRLGAIEFLAKPVPLDVLGAVLQHAEVFAAGATAPRHERRGAGRVPVALPVRAVTEKGKPAAGLVVEASAAGVRLKLEPAFRVGTPLRLTIALSGGVSLEVVALIIRADADGTLAAWFLDITPADADRLLSQGGP